MPADTVKIDRTTRWGNPFVIGADGTREKCIADYGHFVTGNGRTVRENVLVARAFVRGHIGELRGKNLACWCPMDGPCHGDILLELANR